MAAKFRGELLTEDNYYMWQRRMEPVLMGKKYWAIVSGAEEAPIDTTREVQLTFIQRSQNALFTIRMGINDDCLGTTEDTLEPRVL